MGVGRVENSGRRYWWSACGGDDGREEAEVAVKAECEGVHGADVSSALPSSCDELSGVGGRAPAPLRLRDRTM